MNERADWISWSLQFVAGLIAGACVGTMIVFRSRSIRFIAQGTAPVFILGVGLMGAALASHFGDRLWLDAFYRVIPPKAPEQSSSSRIASIATGTIGVFLVFLALALTR